MMENCFALSLLKHTQVEPPLHHLNLLKTPYQYFTLQKNLHTNSRVTHYSFDSLCSWKMSFQSTTSTSQYNNIIASQSSLHLRFL
mmetsp:Transcript_27234/g.58369  ORF Transcript_27234/g.58369 Transcript_27234/m.58369 type:complete len:85 (-) Transcript_27234:1346-1600(-)